MPVSVKPPAASSSDMEDDDGPDGMYEAFSRRMAQGQVEAGLVAGKNVSQKEIGRRAGEIMGTDPISETTMSRYFRGKRLPETLDLICALARAMHVDPGWLAFGEDSEAPAPRSARADGYDKA